MTGDEGIQLKKVHASAGQKRGGEEFRVTCDGVGLANEANRVFSARVHGACDGCLGRKNSRGQAMEVATSPLPREHQQSRADHPNQQGRESA